MNNNQFHFISKHKLIIFLLLYHLCFAYIAHYRLTQQPADAQNYWFVGKDLSGVKWENFLKPGTDVVKLFTFPFVRYFHFPFWSGFVIFSLLSFFGIYLLYVTMNKIAEGEKNTILLAILLLLLPNLHFWTSNIGKESLLILPISIIIYQVYKQKFYSFALISSVFFIAAIRPHLAFILLISYIISILFTQQLSGRFRLILCSGFVICTVFFTFLLFQLQDFSGGFYRIIQKYDAHIRYFKQTDSYVPMDQYAFPYKMFTFYFRPLLFERQGLLYQIAGLENLIILILSCITLFFSLKYIRRLIKNMLFVFPFFLMFLYGLMYVFAYANFGIILRTKIIILPFYYIALLQVFSTVLSNKNTVNGRKIVYNNRRFARRNLFDKFEHK
ncbi:hypothetical protein [Chryseobacterium wangxinyae]|uniref:hypothetical protein n=1 Tax=Chryseobacterium sp. CY353 TaxID=2997334 RepID=UPI0022720502|nr:hypothetical protein [Chryseobacterium sp. CY353]MCY0970079.1 hypothetical protein [Chryseobacterium sp. CY353]